MTAILFCAFLALVLTGAGWSLVRWLDRSGGLTSLERAFAGFLLGALALHFAVFAIGPLRLDAVSMGGVAAVLTLAALPGLFAMPWKEAAAQFQIVRTRLRDDPFLALLVLGLLAVCLSSFLQALAPPNDYDSLMYHLATPKLDIERGRMAPDYARALANVFFPHLVSNLCRFALALAGEQAAQPTVALLGFAATLGTFLLARRAGCSAKTVLLAALMFAACRAVVWEMGTVEVDLPLSATSAAALLIYAVWREKPSGGLILLFGAMLGMGFNIKYQGGLMALAFGPLLLSDLILKRASLASLALAPLTALALFLPHLIETYHATGNAIFPLFHHRLVAGGFPFYQDYDLTYGTGRRIIDLLAAPWSISVAPMHFYDGMVLGAPYLIAFLPGLFLAKPYPRHLSAFAVVAAAYFILWFFVQPQQVRFLMPLLPILCVMTAIGCRGLWQGARDSRVARYAFAALALGLGLNEGMFAGIYAAIRLPVALGLQTPLDYHQKTPTLQGAFFATCRYISERLKPGESYISLLGPHSYYCPQLGAIQRNFPDEDRDWLFSQQRHVIDFPDFLARIEARKIRFVIVPTSAENRRNDTGAQIVVQANLADTRFGPFLMPALERLKPVMVERFSAAYDGEEVLTQLRAVLASGAYPDLKR
jgi:hypothetical protein